MKKLLAILLMLALMMTVAGCGGNDAEPSVEESVPQQTEGTEPSTEETIPNQTETTEPSQPEQEDTLAVDQLRQQMIEKDKSFAVAYLGYMTYDYENVWEFIDGLGASVLEKLPFLNQIPETNVITNASQGEVYCFIPADPDTIVKVFPEDTETDCLYEGTGADPYLLVCNSEYSADSAVTFTELVNNEEITKWWYPQIDDYLYLDQPRYANGTTESLDITPYNEMLLTYYADVQADGDWVIPTKEELVNTTWYWDGYNLNGNYYEYRVTFYEDTVDVRWNPGYGETQTYQDAQWSYEEGEISMLTIDFDQLAGLRKYNLLVDRDAGMMYIAVDATGETLIWNMEPLYRFLLLEQPETASPLDLVGTWERTLTEVDGDVNETPAGQVTVTITGTGETDLQITYEDKEFPDNNYSDKAVAIVRGGDNMGFGDAEWIAEVDHVGNYGKTFALAIVDGQLVIRNYFEVDGAPGVSYETFRRVN